ncbi:class IV adenylate cyclase [Haloarchaeobius sp. HME9146]|uniref:class IV adenylate cyclase n=1 Tax=Haloarchaeobius sp. HME9146 TaxID=2978732 RepID=UPI0021BFD98C|nr:class IV adenylate cyclase [Haloarchaeobius sp. HME9146]MCT9096895.1 class IV adenylate cyclase [Haloarchaeobius sp. HME9146]
MYEVEVKVRADHGPVRERLAEHEAVPVDAVVQEDVYYDAPHRDFAATDEALRIRREASIDPDATDSVAAAVDSVPSAEFDAHVTYKGPLVEAESKTREEFETLVAAGETMDEILSRLGFEPAATVRKRRERFALDGYTVTLDAVEGLGEYVECEVETDEESVEDAREGAFEVLRSLGLDPDDQIRTSYLGLLLAGEATSE